MTAAPPQRMSRCEGHEPQRADSCRHLEDARRVISAGESVTKKLAGEFDPAPRCRRRRCGGARVLLARCVLPHTGSVTGIDILTVDPDAAAEHVIITSTRLRVARRWCSVSASPALALITRRWVFAGRCRRRLRRRRAFSACSSVWSRNTPGVSAIHRRAPGSACSWAGSRCSCSPSYWIRIVWARTTLPARGRAGGRNAAASGGTCATATATGRRARRSTDRRPTGRHRRCRSGADRSGRAEWTGAQRSADRALGGLGPFAPLLRPARAACSRPWPCRAPRPWRPAPRTARPARGTARRGPWPRDRCARHCVSSASLTRFSTARMPASSELHLLARDLADLVPLAPAARAARALAASQVGAGSIVLVLGRAAPALARPFSSNSASRSEAAALRAAKNTSWAALEPRPQRVVGVARRAPGGLPLGEQVAELRRGLGPSRSIPTAPRPRRSALPCAPSPRRVRGRARRSARRGARLNVSRALEYRFHSASSVLRSTPLMVFHSSRISRIRSPAAFHWVDSAAISSASAASSSLRAMASARPRSRSACGASRSHCRRRSSSAPHAGRERRPRRRSRPRSAGRRRLLRRRRAASCGSPVPAARRSSSTSTSVASSSNRRPKWARPSAVSRPARSPTARSPLGVHEPHRAVVVDPAELGGSEAGLPASRMRPGAARADAGRGPGVGACRAGVPVRGLGPGAASAAVRACSVMFVLVLPATRCQSPSSARR